MGIFLLVRIIITTLLASTLLDTPLESPAKITESTVAIEMLGIDTESVVKGIFYEPNADCSKHHSDISEHPGVNVR